MVERWKSTQAKTAQMPKGRRVVRKIENERHGEERGDTEEH